MAHTVFCPQQVAEDRYIVLELRSFLWIFKWWRPVPNLYVDYDRLLVEEKNSKLLTKQLEAERKRVKAAIDAFVETAYASYNQGNSKSSYSRKRRTKRVDTPNLPVLYDVHEEGKPTNNHKGRGPPSSSEHTASDRPPQGANNSNNQKGGHNKGSGGGR